MTSSLQSSPRSVLTASVVGRGRLGRAVSRALGASGIRVHGPTGRREVVEPADVVLLCVPDSDLIQAAADLRDSGAFIGHMSGAMPLAEIDVDFGLHPLQTFVGDEGPAAFHGIGCAVAGRSPEALGIARELAVRLGARPFCVADEHRAGYHAAASIASNFVVTLMAAAEQVAASAGITASEARVLLVPLVRTTVENWAEHGPNAALTGPIARGDRETVDKQRRAVALHAPDLLALFDSMCASTAALAAKGRPAA